MNTERFIARRIIKGNGNSNKFSRPIVRISVLGIALGLAVMILTLCIVVGFQNEIKKKVIGFGSHITITNYDNNESNEPQPISKEQPFLTELNANPEIKHLQVYTTKVGIIKTKTVNEEVLLKGVGEDYDWKFINDNMVSGKPLQLSDTGLSRDVVVSKSLSDKLELKLNDKMVVYFLIKKPDSISGGGYEQRARVFFITGIYETGFSEIDDKLAFVDIRQIQKLNYWTPQQVGGMEISIRDIKKLDEVNAAVNDLIGQGLSSQTIKETSPAVFAWLDLFDVNAIIVIVFIILVAGINMISALLVLILERTNMIGILKALGASNGSIQKIFLYNAGYLISKGLLWGNIIGIGVAVLQKYLGLFKLDKTQYYMSQVPIDINIITILLLNIGTLACCMLMLIIPSFIISRITPVKAIRFS